MSLRKRLRNIETSLTPKQAVLLRLKEILTLDYETHWKEVLAAAPHNPRDALLKMVADAIRQNLSEPGLKPDQLELVVREGQKQAQMLIILILNLHELVRSKFGPAVLYAKLIIEKMERTLDHFKYEGEFEAETGEAWRAQITERLSEMRLVKEVVMSISAKYFDGHPLLFASDEARLNAEIAVLEEIAAFYNGFQNQLPGWSEINVDAQLSSTRDCLEVLVARLVDIARAETLQVFGESEAAGELLHGSHSRALSELERLGSSIRLQDNVTS